MTTRATMKSSGVSLIIVMAVAAGAFGQTAQARPRLIDWQIWAPGVNMYHYLGPIDLHVYGSIPAQSWYFSYGSPSYGYGSVWPGNVPGPWPYGYLYSPYYYQSPFYGQYYYPYYYWAAPHPYEHYHYYPIHPYFYRGRGFGMERHEEHRGFGAPGFRAAPHGHG
jgi:hypothetical protein